MASKLETDAVEPQSGTTLTLGAAGDTVDLSTAAVTLPADTIGTAQLSATGTASSGTFLRGDNAWATAGVDTLATLTDATVSASDPTISSNPSAVGHLWLNSTSGESYVATDITAGANVWTNIGGGAGNISTAYSVDFLVIAGGGGGSAGAPSGGGGGGGAGGYRNSYNSETSGGGGSSESALTILSGTEYTITVGAGGAITGGRGANGGDSSIAGSDITDITSLGGGYGGWSTENAGAGGSGGGSDQTPAPGAGTANQGYAGGQGSGNGGGGGGGAGAVGGTLPAANIGGAGGVGVSSSITGSAVTRGGGGGGSSNTTGGAGGSGGGGAAATNSASNNATAGTVNTGGGGGGAYDVNPGAAGGSGVVILRMATSSYSGTTTGSPSVTTSGSDTIITYNGSGTYTG